MLLDLKKTAKDIYNNLLYVSIILFLKDSYLVLKIDFVNLPSFRGLSERNELVTPVLGTGWCSCLARPFSRLGGFFFFAE